MTEAITSATEEIRRQVEAVQEEYYLRDSLLREAQAPLTKNARRSIQGNWKTVPIPITFEDGKKANVYLISRDKTPKVSKVKNFTLRFDLLAIYEGATVTSPMNLARFGKDGITNLRGESPNLDELRQIDIMLKFLKSSYTTLRAIP